MLEEVLGMTSSYCHTSLTPCEQIIKYCSFLLFVSMQYSSVQMIFTVETYIREKSNEIKNTVSQCFEFIQNQACQIVKGGNTKHLL
jgi:hypothetical protein